MECSWAKCQCHLNATNECATCGSLLLQHLPRGVYLIKTKTYSTALGDLAGFFVYWFQPVVVGNFNWNLWSDIICATTFLSSPGGCETRAGYVICGAWIHLALSDVIRGKFLHAPHKLKKGSTIRFPVLKSESLKDWETESPKDVAVTSPRTLRNNDEATLE